jgi:hypothetical protein
MHAQESRHCARLILYFEQTDDKKLTGAFTISRRHLDPTGREVDPNPEPPPQKSTGRPLLKSITSPKVSVWW